MRILYSCPDTGIPVLGRKGASVHVRELISAFGRAGHNVVLAAPTLQMKPWEEAEEFGGRLLHIPPTADSQDIVSSLKEFNEMFSIDNVFPGQLRRIIYNQEFLKHLKREYSTQPPDFIYERSSIFSIASARLASELKRPLLLEVNAPLALEQATYRGIGLAELAAQVEKWMLSRADAVLAVSAQLKDYVVSLGANAEQVHVIPNAVNTKIFYPCAPDPAIRASWGLGSGPIIGFVGGLRQWHGIQILPELLERLRVKYPRLQLVIAGDGPLREELESDIKGRNLAQNVVFTGSLPHERVVDIIRQFDIALAPYPVLQHDFYFSPLKLFEYMACGIPTVASDIGQIAEVVRNGETGLLYPAGQLDALVACCETFLSNRNLREMVGQAASDEIVKKHTWDRNAKYIIELAGSLIDNWDRKSRSGLKPFMPATLAG